MVGVAKKKQIVFYRMGYRDTMHACALRMSENASIQKTTKNDKTRALRLTCEFVGRISFVSNKAEESRGVAFPRDDSRALLYEACQCLPLR
jgi:hypothetical protein